MLVRILGAGVPLPFAKVLSAAPCSSMPLNALELVDVTAMQRRWTRHIAWQACGFLQVFDVDGRVDVDARR